MNSRFIALAGFVGFAASVITVFEFFTPSSMEIVELEQIDACSNEIGQRKKFLKFLDEVVKYNGKTVYLNGLTIMEPIRCENYNPRGIYFSDVDQISLSTDYIEGTQFSNLPKWTIASIGLYLPPFWSKSEYGKAVGGENSYELDGPVTVSVRNYEEVVEITLSLGNVSGGAYQEYLCTRKVANRGYLLGKLSCILKI